MELHELVDRLRENLFPTPEPGEKPGVRVLCSKSNCTFCAYAQQLFQRILDLTREGVSQMDEVELKVEDLEVLRDRSDKESQRTDLDVVEIGWLQKLSEATRELAIFRKARLDKAGGSGCQCQEQVAEKAPEGTTAAE